MVREGVRSSTAEELLSQLRVALATESSRVATAWEQRERMRAVVAERDATLRQLQTEACHMAEDLGASREQARPEPSYGAMLISLAHQLDSLAWLIGYAHSLMLISGGSPAREVSGAWPA